jgi:elongin-A
MRIESPAQLHEIETNSPQICGEDEELWRSFIARDFPRWERKNYAPKNPLKWYRVYLKYKKEQQLEIARDEEILRASMGQLKRAKETNVSKVMDLKALPKVPRDPWMMANNGGVPIGKRAGLFKKEGPSSLVWSAGSKTKMMDGKSVLTRARREAKEISQRSKLAKPTHELQAQVGQVRKAPVGMVNEYRKASEPTIRILSKKKSSVGKSTGRIDGPSLEEREKRLAAIQAGINRQQNNATADETLIGSSDEDELSITDRFAEKLKARSRPAASSSSRPISNVNSASSQSASMVEQSTSQQVQHSFSPIPGTATKQSSYTSSPVNHYKSRPRPTGSPTTPAISTLRSRSQSPSHTERRQPTAVRKRRTEVDIFNRGPAKKSRTR